MIRRRKRAPLPGVLLEVVDNIDGDPDYTEAPDRDYTRDLEAATVITSRVDPSPDLPLYLVGAGYRPDMHKVVLDIDLPASLVPSTTPGHYHLFIDKAITWANYTALLHALANAGIVEPGYVGASIARGHTAARLPWVKKAKP